MNTRLLTSSAHSAIFTPHTPPYLLYAPAASTAPCSIQGGDRGAFTASLKPPLSDFSLLSPTPLQHPHLIIIPGTYQAHLYLGTGCL